MNVCVYGSSSDQVDRRHFETARRLGQLLGERKNNLVCGGGNTGPIQALAAGVKEKGGRVISLIPRMFENRGLAFNESDEVVVTEDLQERRLRMVRESDVFLALPGGFGTLEEVCENLTMRQLGVHDKPLALVDTNGFWKPFLGFMNQLAVGRFILPEHESLLRVLSTPEEALRYVDGFTPKMLPDKWGAREEPAAP